MVELELESGDAARAFADLDRTSASDLAIGPPLQSRKRFLAAALGAAGAIVGGGTIGGLTEAASAKPSRAQDIEILNFLLLLEYLAAAHYAAAVKRGRLRGELLRYAQLVGSHERRHVAALRKMLGGSARSEPRFRFGSGTRGEGFLPSTVRLEEVMTSAYIAQAANLTRRRMPGVARIVSVEARHTAWIRAVAGRVPAPRAADLPLAPRAVTRALQQMEIEIVD